MSDGWALVYDHFVPSEEGVREALCTLGNGIVCTRGAGSECVADETHYPGTYFAGLYNRLETELAGRTVENEDLVNAPNWLPLTFRVGDGPWLDLASLEILEYRQTLDLKRGLLTRLIRFRDGEGRTTQAEFERFVCMRVPYLAAQRMTVMGVDWSGLITVRSALDGTVTNAGVARYRTLDGKHLRPISAERSGDNLISLKVQTIQSEVTVAMTARTRVWRDGDRLDVERRTIQSDGYVAEEFGIAVDKGHNILVEKVAALRTSRDPAIAECGLSACADAAHASDCSTLLHGHVATWDRLWSQFGIELSDREEAIPAHIVTTLRLHVFHLLQTVSPNTMERDVGVPARGWHGEGYRGHVFWDELFIFPLLNLRMPEITRGLLKYRYRRLEAAREAARRAGFAGAMFPWQSGSDGRETSQSVHLNPASGRWIPDNSALQRHVNAAIAFNTWQYYETTGDAEFLSFYGAEMILEIARFWASIATSHGADGRYDILGIMGPDEYHDAYPDADHAGLNNNAYTNVMAAWTLARALSLSEILPLHRWNELRVVLMIGDDELARWRDVSRGLRLCFHDGVISQFEGYDQLAEFDWEGYRRKYGDIRRLDRILEAEGDTPNRYKLSKQADVLMLFYLFSAEGLAELFEQLGYEFDPAMIPRTIDYYARRTAHGSTLSRVVHSWVLARSDRARSWQLFCEALHSDIGDTQGGTTKEGIHLGAMAGAVNVLEACYTGLEARGGVLWLNPALPEALERLEMRLRYRGMALALAFARDAVEIETQQGSDGAIRIGFKGEIEELRAGEKRRFAL